MDIPRKNKIYYKNNFLYIPLWLKILVEMDNYITAHPNNHIYAEKMRKEFKITSGYIHKILDVLELKGLVTGQRSGRVIYRTVTAEGVQLCQIIRNMQHKKIKSRISY